ncbi:Secreted protein acidic and rich in cysteine Ca Hypothetical protein region [Nesidiocoris tenuis]|uniref:SPARC-related modular calcium-binding protein 1 n=1 Tax=Nesidiocoris tenuis TaxID=355587 RepID=A0ABN7B1G7_9HEMI|nr:Secreted protein acidic and rich in cysteine Ca Hypothetical protein region [Nesidiocoris tenuis]
MVARPRPASSTCSGSGVRASSEAADEESTFKDPPPPAEQLFGLSSQCLGGHGSVMFGTLRYPVAAFVSVLFLVSGASASPINKTECTEKVRECERRGPVGAVCGTDKRTYQSRCHLLRAACNKGLNIKVKRRGVCPDSNACWEGVGSSVEGHNYVPQCLPDGRYAPVQCHDATKYCWCVTPQGKPIAGTSVRGQRPKCNRKGCGRIERATFVNNLNRLFLTEFQRTLNVSNNMSIDGLERAAVEWKFRKLDNDANGTLIKREYKSLRKLVRKFVKPKGCARSFTRFCDANKDTELTLDEWTSCLKKKNLKKPLKEKPKKKEDSVDLDLFGNHGATQGSVLIGPLPDPGVEEPGERRDEIEAVDCLSDRKSALEEQQGNLQRFFVPECALDGRYKKIQCYNSTGYCWCVDEDSGKPIPGTSVKDPNPQCDAVQPPPRPMKGCPDEKKLTFLKDFMKHLNSSMVNHFTSERRDIPLKQEQQAEFDQAINWYFHHIDSNGNKVLERKEWKALRKLMTSNRKLKRCGKKLPRYCDVNQDRKISYTEWLNCLNNNASSVPPPKPGPQIRQVGRRGPNPFESLLKHD